MGTIKSQAKHMKTTLSVSDTLTNHYSNEFVGREKLVENSYRNLDAVLRNTSLLFPVQSKKILCLAVLVTIIELRIKNIHHWEREIGRMESYRLFGLIARFF